MNKEAFGNKLLIRLDKILFEFNLIYPTFIDSIFDSKNKKPS
jgi:hypothetical protein